ncbi:hypothetical protein LCGC14_1988330 [marine sediment metagenome]|uniref:Uncharacterized protein n=1 Tax=marine sediment metagenome TaxID=412755 RepID=A0A0F9HK66_9ZZZZ
MYRLAICKTYGYSIVRRLILAIKRWFSTNYVMIHKQIDLRLYDGDDEE